MTKPWIKLQAIGARYHDDLPVELTDDETLERGASLAKAQQHVREVEADATIVRATLRTTLKEARAEADRLAQVVAERREDRQVECELRADFQTGTVYIVRTDTDNEVNQRPMTSDDRQMQIIAPGDDPGTDEGGLPARADDGPELPPEPVATGPTSRERAEAYMATVPTDVYVRRIGNGDYDDILGDINDVELRAPTPRGRVLDAISSRIAANGADDLTEGGDDALAN